MANGHTHGEDYVDEWKENGKSVEYSSVNKFSGSDIRFYNNAILDNDNIIPNKFNKKIHGFLITPNGGLLHYDPNKSYEEIKIKEIFGLTPSYNEPIYKELPSDVRSRGLRLNQISCE